MRPNADLFYLIDEISGLGEVLKQWQAWLETYIAPLQIVIAADVTVKALTENLGAWASIDEREATLAKHRALRTCLGPVARGVSTDWKSVHATEAWVDEIQKVGLPHPWFEALLSMEDEAIWAQVIQVISQSAEAWQEIHTTFVGFDRHLNGATKWLKEHITLELAKRVEALIQEADFLPRWSQFCRLRAKADELGMGPYFHAWEKGEIEHTQLTEMFQLVEYRRMAAAEIQLNPTLRNFVAEPHEKTREKFRQLDKELIRLNQQAIASSIGARQMPVGNGQGPRRTHTEGSLVRTR